MAEDLRCCELARLVYDCPDPCGWRVYEELHEVYATMRTCEECHDDERGIFPSQMELAGLRCPVHGWQPAPHLRQAPLFPWGLAAPWRNVADAAGGKQFATDHVPPPASAVAAVGASMADRGPALVLTHPSPAAPKAEEVCRHALPGLAVRGATSRASVRQL